MIFFPILFGLVLKISSGDKVVYKEPGFSIRNIRQKYNVISFEWGSHPDLKNGSLLVKCCLFRCDVLKNLLLVLYEAVKLQHVHTVVFYWRCRTALIAQIVIYWLFILSPFLWSRWGDGLCEKGF